MRAFILLVLVASAHCYGPPSQPAPAASQNKPTGLTEFCGTNCLQQQPVIEPQPEVQPQVVIQPQPVHSQLPVDPQPNYSNNPFLNGAVDFSRPSAASSVAAVVTQQQPVAPAVAPQKPVTYPQEGSYQQQNAPQPNPSYANNPYLTGQVGVNNNSPAAKACDVNTLCVARPLCSSGVLHQENALQAKSQNEPCDQSRGETCCRVPQLVQQGAGSPVQIVQQQQPGSSVNYQSTTYRPYTGPQNTTPHPGCAAALKCVTLEYCTAAGVISDVPVVLQRDDTRVPMSECQDPDTGILGFCCRDPNYKDPWPETQEICDQGTSCEAMWRCPQDRMAFPKKGCRVNQDGSTGICCLPPRGGVPQQSFAQGQQQQVAANVIDSRPIAVPSKPFGTAPQPINNPYPQPGNVINQGSSQNNIPRPVAPVVIPQAPALQQSQASFAQQQPKPSYPQQQQPSYPQQQPSIPQQTKPSYPQQQQQPSIPQQPNPTYPQQQPKPTYSQQQQQPSIPQQQQPSYPQQQPSIPQQQQQPVIPQQPPSYGQQQPSYPNTPAAGSKPSTTQFFQQQSPATITNQFPVKEIKVPASPVQTPFPPSYEAPITIPAPTSGCGVRSVSPGTPQDGESAPGEFPWQALVTSTDGTRLCAGAVISESAILISATCIQGRDTSLLQVEVGSWSPYSTANERQTASVLVTALHPRYDANTQANDLAVLMLSQSLRFGRFVGAVCLPNAEELNSQGLLQQPGGACLISSWPKPADSSSKLSRVSMRPVDSQQCEESLRGTYLGKYFQLHNSFMCAAPLDPKQSMCPIGLGGALVCPRSDGRYLVLGASSWDVGCSQPQPAVMCSLDVEWVNQVLQTPVQDLQQQQQRREEQFAVAPGVAEQKPGFSQGYGR